MRLPRADPGLGQPVTGCSGPRSLALRRGRVDLTSPRSHHQRAQPTNILLVTREGSPHLDQRCTPARCPDL